MADLSAQVPPHLLAALVPLVVLAVALDAYCLIDRARARSMGRGAKLAWAAVIVFVSAPLGALLYLLVGRDRGRDRPDPQAWARRGQPEVGGHGDPGPAGAPSRRETAPRCSPPPG
jgi:hypothetical protein